MAYADLTTEQKVAVDALANFVRANASTLAKLGNQGRAVASAYVGNVESMLSGLQSGDVIPNKSGLAEAQPLTKTELVNLIGYFMTMSETADASPGSYNTNYHRALYAKAAGVGNIV